MAQRTAEGPQWLTQLERISPGLTKVLEDAMRRGSPESVEQLLSEHGLNDLTVERRAGGEGEEWDTMIIRPG